MIRNRSQYSEAPSVGSDLPAAGVMCNEVKKPSTSKSTVFTWLIFFVLLFISVLGKAQEQQETREFNIRSQQADKGLKTFGRQADVTVLYRFGVIKKYQTNKLIGNYTIAQAIDILLKNTQLTGQFDQSGNLLIKEKQQSQTEDENMIPGTKRTLVAAAVAASLSPAVNAQEQTKNQQAEAETEVIEVRGIRSSLAKSLSVKQDSTGFVDAITAEDVGKLPDNNVAEALQRVAGVAIERSRGEGDFISIRGLGRDFVNGSLNGRTLISATETFDPNFNGQTPTTTGRATNFDILPSEIVTSLEVTKSPSANQIEGGVAGAVDVKTARPLALGDKIAFSANVTNREHNDENDPSFSGLYSWSNEDNLGLLASLSYSDRSLREDFSRQFFWLPTNAFVAGQNPRVDTNNDGNGDANLADLWQPLSNNPEVFQESRERITAAVTAQWVSDSSEFIFDVLYSKREVDETHQNFIHLPIATGNLVDGATGALTGQVNPDGSVRVGDVFPRIENQAITSINSTLRPEVTHDVQNYEDELISVAANFRTDIAGWVASADVSYSSAEGGYDFARVRWDANNGSFRHNTQTSVDGFRIRYEDTSALSQLATYDLFEFDNRAATNEDEDFAIKFDFQRDLDNEYINSIELGARFNSRSKEVRTFRTVGNAGGSGLTGASAGAFTPGASSFLNGEWDSNIEFSSILFPDHESAYAAIRQDQARLNAIDAGSRTAEQNALLSFYSAIQAAPAENAPTAYDVTEDVFALYFQANIDTEIAGMNLTGDFGIRYVDTQTETIGNASAFTIIEINGADTTGRDDFEITSSQAITVDNDYDHTLPSLNLKLELAEGVFARFAASETISRSPFGSYVPSFSLNANSADLNGDLFGIALNAGNAQLQPLESRNIDLGLEYYFGDASAVYISYFNKDLSNYVVSRTLNGSITEFGGVAFDLTGVDGAARLNPRAIPADSVTAPTNAGDGTISGIELGIQQSFESGFGYIANLTTVDSEASFQFAGEERQVIPAFGVSDLSYNVAGYYESGPFQARISYNYRDEFLNQLGGLGGELVNDEYGQLDASLSYDLNENITLVFSATNLNDETQRIFHDLPESGGGSRQLYGQNYIGKRFTLGVRGSF